MDGRHWFQLHIVRQIGVAFVYVTDARGSVVSYEFAFRASSITSALLVMLQPILCDVIALHT